MPDIRSLYELQEVDLELSALKKHLSKIRTQLTDNSEISSARQHAQELTLRDVFLSGKGRVAEKDVTEIKETLDKLTSRLYSGSITKAKEMSAAQEEQEYIIKQQEMAENILLELMVEIEECMTKLDEATQRLKKLESDSPKLEQSLKNEESQFSNKVDILQERRDTISMNHESKTLSIYESVRKNKDGEAISKVKQGMCQGCRLTLPHSELQQAKNSNRITQCSSCNRILYVM